MKNKRLLKILGNLDLYIAMMVISTLILLTFLGVIMRYFIGKPFIWQEEIQLSLITWVIFLGGSAAFRGSNHIAIEFLVELFPKKIQRVFDGAIYLIVTGVLFFVAFNGHLLVSQFSRTSRITSILHIPTQYIYFIIPLGCALMIISNTYDTWQRFSGKATKKEDDA